MAGANPHEPPSPVAPDLTDDDKTVPLVTVYVLFACIYLPAGNTTVSATKKASGPYQKRASNDRATTSAFNDLALAFGCDDSLLMFLILQNVCLTLGCDEQP